MLNIITPLYRIENLLTLKENFLQVSKKFHPKQVQWTIIIDRDLIEKVSSSWLCYHLSETGINWHWSSETKAFVGHAHRNHFINEYAWLYININHSISNPDYTTKNNYKEWTKISPNICYAYFLDDDTILHPEFLENVIPVLENNDPEILIFGQNNKDNSIRLLPSYENIKVGYIDMGQYIFKINSLPPHIRFDETDYCADGVFIEKLFKYHGIAKTKIIKKQLSYYNYLR